ncbi:MAG: hypothetical protein HY696_12805 [Deltaproteobacteria bacterium]|nr:hypothetical protein [Deltaproteobacteria bacterium]
MTPRPTLFAANNPGGLRALLPVIPHFPAHQLWIPTALQPLVNTEAIVVRPIDPETSAQSVLEQLHALHPATLVTGTSVVTAHGGDYENQLRIAARTLGIPSVAILDHWCNYSARFTTRDGPLRDALPDRICVMNARARDEMIAEGFPANRLCITGHPDFDALVTLSAADRKMRRLAVRQQLGIPPDTRVIGLLTEPVAGDYETIRGYDELEVVTDCLHSCAMLAPPTTILLKPHPREAHDKYHDRLHSTPLRIFHAPATLSGHEVVLASDLVVGITTILLLEALLLHCPSLSYQPHIDATAPWARFIQPVPVITDRDALTASLREGLNQHGTEQHPLADFYSERNATQNVIVAVSGVSDNPDGLAGRGAGTAPRTGK